MTSECDICKREADIPTWKYIKYDTTVNYMCDFCDGVLNWWIFERFDKKRPVTKSICNICYGEKEVTDTMEFCYGKKIPMDNSCYEQTRLLIALLQDKGKKYDTLEDWIQKFHKKKKRR